MRKMFFPVVILLAVAAAGWMDNFSQLVRLRARVIGRYWPRVKEWVVDQSKPGTLDSEIHRK